MRLWAGALFVLAVLAAGVPELCSELRPFGLLSLALGLPLSVLFFVRVPGCLQTLGLAALVAGVGLSEIAGLSGWWVALSLPLGLLAWDLAHTARQLDGFEMRARRRFALQYLVRGTLYGVTGFAIIGVALQSHWSMGFGVAVFLTAGAVISAVLIIRQLWPRPKRRQRNAPSTPQACSQGEWRGNSSDS